jgi:sec-independent protein translocase protein TatA
MLSPTTVAILFGIGLLLVGPKKLPELGKALGQGIGNFKKALHEAQDEVKNAMHAQEKPSKEAAQPEPAKASTPDKDTPGQNPPTG